MSVVIETSIGDIVIDLYVEERPTCCKNFLKLCKMKYYNFCLFHNVQKNYIAQTGDPTGTGRGGESVFNYVYGDQARYFEMEKFPIIKHKKLGTVSMINNSNDHHGSQFLITLAEKLDYLDGKHTIFGEVAKGFDVLEKFNECICDKEGRPYRDIRIFHTVILHDPFEDFASLSDANGRASPEPTDERLDSDRIRVDEEVGQLDDMSQEEIEKYMKEREAKTRAKLLEIIGDLPDADMKPPENVLFVCKLNPVTSDEDLELIFSRFGKINSCEVIRDSKTGDSLCYAFIEFDREEDCENAYFKMDNVLIDDRRIHVDFSQSVAKVTWKGKGTGTGYFEDNRSFRNNKPNEKSSEKSESNNLRFNDKSRKGHGYDLVIDEEESYIKNERYVPITKDRKRFDNNNSQSQNYSNDRNKISGNYEDMNKRDRYDQSKYLDKQRDYDKYSKPERHRLDRSRERNMSSSSYDRDKYKTERERRERERSHSRERDQDSRKHREKSKEKKKSSHRRSSDEEDERSSSNHRHHHKNKNRH